MEEPPRLPLALPDDLPRSTRHLVELLPRGAHGPTLDVASHRGCIAALCGCTYVNDDLPACGEAAATGAPGVVHSDVLPTGPFATIAFDARTYDPAHADETVAFAARALVPDGVLLTTARAEAVARYFDSAEEVNGAVLGSRPKATVDSPPWPVYEATVRGKIYRIQSAPGLFSPRGLDEGTAAMLDRIPVPAPGTRFLDLGCGAGIVAKVASEGWGCQVTAVDVSARALRLTSLNAPTAQVVASDGFRQLGSQQFDLVTSNPPYHTDFAIAKRFIEDAFRHLVPGGMLYLVVKRSNWYEEKVRSVFGGCRSEGLGAYTLILAERRSSPRHSESASRQKTTKKHSRRLQRRK